MTKQKQIGRIDRLGYEDPQCQVLHTCQSHRPPIRRARWDYVRLCERPLQADWGSKSLTSITINNFQPGLFFFTAAIQVNELCLFFKLVKSSIGKLKMKGNPRFESGALRATLPKLFSVQMKSSKSFGGVTSRLSPSCVHSIQ